MTLTVGSLFAGIGGFDLGLERAGMRVIWQSEIDPYASAVLRKHWPNVPNHGDIRSIRAGAAERPDLICGGFPCQPFSHAGKRAGKDDDRHLWPEMCRVIDELRPAWVIGENVAGIISMELDQVLSDLEALGYATRTFVIPAVAVDAPHRRDRCWIIACDRDRDRESTGAVDAEASGLSGDCYEWPEPFSIIGTGNGRSEYHAAIVADADEPRSKRRDGAILRERADECAIGAGGAYGRPSHWLPEPDVGRVAHGIPAKLDRGGYAEEEQHSQSREEGDGRRDGMPDMRGDREIGASSSRLCTAGSDRGAMPIVSHQSGPAGRHAEGQGNEEMRALRLGLPAEAQQEALPMQRGLPLGGRAHQRAEAMVWTPEPSIGRVATGVANRVDRLRCLGNAVVPQVVEIIGKAIIEAERAR